MGHFETLRDYIFGTLMPKYKGLPSGFVDYMKTMTEYTVSGGKLNRGLTVVHSLAALKGDTLTKEETERAASVGWCIEWLQAFFLVADDIMDDSPMRRGKPAWFKTPGVGLNAINDSFLLKSHISHILRFACGEDAALYGRLQDAFLEVTWRTELGQGLDLTSFEDGSAARGDFENYTEERYLAIVEYKTAYYTFWLPVVSALLLAGVTDEAAMATARNVCVEMGRFFQTQDDYLDCFGDPAVIGKVGTDIEEGKCSWLCMRALETASEEQKAVLAANIGRREPEHVAAVKALYRELELPARFEALEEATDKRMTGLIAECDASTGGQVPALLFERLWAKTHKRTK